MPPSQSSWALSKNRAGRSDDASAAQVLVMTSEHRAPASASRRQDPDDDARPTRFAAVRAAQVRAVGAAFLRARPLVVAPVALINGVLATLSGAPAAQRLALAIAFGTALTLFVAERWWLRRAAVSERWLATSLILTSLLLALGCALSGGLVSPVLPLTLAPVAIAMAAFGRSRTTILAATASLASIVALALLPAGTPFAAVPAPWARAMTVTSFVGLLLLTYAGVVGLVGAYVTSGEVLDRMRLATIEEAASRMRATEQVGAKVAHELKNPLAAIKALLQLLRGAGDERAGKRLEVALGEVERMDGIVRDYLAFARPLADLDVARVELRALADEVVAVLEARAEVAGVQLTATGPAHAILGDARRLREALYNLADNAVTATPRGGAVTLRVEATLPPARGSPSRTTGPACRPR